MRIFFEKKVSRNPGRGPAKFTRKLIEGLRQHGIQVVFEYDCGCDLAFCLPHWKQHKGIKIPRIMRADGTMPGGSEKRRRRYARRIRRADFVIWQSEFCRKYASKLFKVSEAGTVIYNGDDPRKYKVEPLPSDGKYHVLLCANWISAAKMKRRNRKKRHHGKYRPEKRLGEMLQIADEYTKKNPDVVFWVAGKTRLSKPENPNIVLLGKVDNKTLCRYIVSANCMLHLAYFDWCPNSVVESLVAGTPVICQNKCGTEEVVRQGFGEVLPIEGDIDVEHYRRSRVMPKIPYESVYAALDRWARCQEKRPAEALFMDNVVKRYIRAFSVIKRRKKI
jgi:glycosyltransferase involved in cell wall biosynthesis